MNPIAQAENKLLPSHKYHNRLGLHPSVSSLSPATPPLLHPLPPLHAPSVADCLHLSPCSLSRSSILPSSFFPLAVPLCLFNSSRKHKNLGILTYRDFRDHMDQHPNVVHEKTTVPRSDFHKNTLLFCGEHMA